MSNHFLQMYLGLGAFTDLEPQPTENKTIVVDIDALCFHMKDFLQKSEDKETESISTAVEEL